MGAFLLHKKLIFVHKGNNLVIASGSISVCDASVSEDPISMTWFIYSQNYVNVNGSWLISLLQATEPFIFKLLLALVTFL